MRPFTSSAGEARREIAPLASVLAAVRRSQPGAVVRLEPGDLRVRTRAAAAHRLVLFVLDGSGSMGARDRMAVTKAALLSLLRERYQARDRIALMVFRDDSTRVVVRPTRDAARAIGQLRTLPTGGRTPLTAALREAAAFVRRHVAGGSAEPLAVVLVTDGRSQQPGQEAAARLLARQPADITVLDTEDGFVRLGRARRLAARLGATYAAI